MAGIRYTKAMPYAAGLALALTLGACSGGGETPPATTPVTTSPPPTSSTTTSAPTTTVPTTSVDPVLARIPAAARPETPEGAAAFARYYFEQLDQASSDGDPRALDGLARDSCKGCTSFYEGVGSLKAEGLSHRGQTLRVKTSDTLKFSLTSTQVLTEVELFAVPVVDGSGKVVRRTQADSGGFVTTLEFDQHWFIKAMQVAK